MSISKAQAEALAEGFLDDIGTDDKGALRPKESYAEIIVLAGELVEDAQQNLIDSNKIASGELSKSIIAGEPYLVNSTLQIDVFMNFYGRFVNKGVKGTRGGSSTAGYSFKNEIVSRKMYDAIKAWIARGKLTTRTVKKYKGYGKHETKQKSIAQLDSAYAVARSIKMKGLKATGFMDKAVKKTADKVGERLGNALRVDVINSLIN
jgi:hypothetical protein